MLGGAAQGYMSQTLASLWYHKQNSQECTVTVEAFPLHPVEMVVMGLRTCVFIVIALKVYIALYTCAVFYIVIVI